MKDGMTIVEVLIAIVVLSVTAATVFPAMGWLITRSRTLQYDVAAAAVMQEGMEAAYNVLLSDWGAMEAGKTYSPGVLVAGGRSEWTVTEGESVVETRFTRGITVSAVCRDGQTGERTDCDGGVEDVNSKLLKTTVKWEERGGDKSVQAELLVTQL